MREFLSDLRSDRGLLVFLGAICLLTLLGPFGAYDALPPARRFFFWRQGRIILTSNTCPKN